MLYTVLDRRTLKCIGSYNGERVSYAYPYLDTINQIHHEVGEGKFPEGYYLLEDMAVAYDFEYNPPVSPPLVIAEFETEKRHLTGFALYRKILADTALGGGMSVIDEVIAVDSYLSPMRNFLKDGRGETALRYFVKHLSPLGIFTPEKVIEYKGWVREYCHEFRPLNYATAADYDVRLDAVETAGVI